MKLKTESVSNSSFRLVKCFSLRLSGLNVEIVESCFDDLNDVELVRLDALVRNIRVVGFEMVSLLFHY